MGSFTVIKFGGTSVANYDSIMRCIDTIKKFDSERILIIVSAQAGVTNKLVDALYKADNIEKNIADIEKILNAIIHNTIIQDEDIACKIASIMHDIHNIKNTIQNHNDLSVISALEYDQVVSLGDIISSYLVTAILLQCNLDALHIDATKVIATDSNHGCAIPDIQQTSQNFYDIIQGANANIIVMSGFIGRSIDTNQITTLGRGGSDYSASIMAEVVNTDKLYILTDVLGIHSAPPKIVNNTKVIDQINIDQAVEISIFGGQVIYPASFQPAIRKHFDIIVGHSFHYPDHQGTYISAHNNFQNNPTIISARHGQMLITISSTEMIGVFGYMSRVLNIFRDNKIMLDVVATSESNIIITLDNNEKDPINMQKNDTAIQALLAIPYANINVEYNMSLISLIQRDIDNHTMRKIFNVISNYDARLLSYGASKSNFNIIVNHNDAEKIINDLHENIVIHDT